VKTDKNDYEDEDDGHSKKIIKNLKIKSKKEE
jgi:hypothetical protein